MRILAIIPSSFYGNTGDSINESQLIKVMSKRVEKIILFHLFRIDKRDNFGQNIPSNIVLIGLPFFPYLGMLSQILYSFSFALFAFILDRLNKIDLIYVRNSLLSFGLIFSKRLRSKSVVKFVSFLEDELKFNGMTKLVFKIIRFIDWIILNKCGKIAVASPLMIGSISRKRGLNREFSSYILLPAGYDPEKIKKIILKRRSKVDNYESRLFRVGFLGNLAEWQGVDLLVRAMKIVQTTESKVELIILGNGPLKHKIEELIRELGVKGEIKGPFPHEKALEMLSSFDVLVLPRRRSETTESTIPIKVIEAWSLGIPVIITRHRVFLEHGIMDFKDVIYCEPQPSSIAKAITIIIRNSKLRDKIIKNGLKIANKFDYNNIAETLLKNI